MVILDLYSKLIQICVSMEKMRELLEELYKVSNLEGLVHLSRFAKANGMSEEAKYYWERYCAIKEYKFEQDAD